MNIETILSEPLRRAVQSAYERRDYTAAILDAVYFLGDVIRERSGLDCDGVALIGQAFGGKSPKLKVNKLETESERNVQQGLESVLRGIYQAIRNPRSHGKHEDSQHDADAIIIFVDFLLRIIGKSTAPFTQKDFLDRVFDSDFVESDRYANLLVADIPEKKRVEVFIEAFRMKESGNGNKLRFFFEALLAAMNDEDKKRALEVVEDELKLTGSETSIRLTIQVIPAPYWEHFSETVRLRIENKLIRSVDEGRYSVRNKKCDPGGLGTWVTSLLGHILLKNEILYKVAYKLGLGSDEEKDYAFNYLLPHIFRTTKEPDDYIVATLKDGLEAGDKRFHTALSTIMKYGSSNWKAPLKEAYEAFKEAEQTSPPEAEELPF